MWLPRAVQCRSMWVVNLHHLRRPSAGSHLLRVISVARSRARNPPRRLMRAHIHRRVRRCASQARVASSPRSLSNSQPPLLRKVRSVSSVRTGQLVAQQVYAPIRTAQSRARKLVLSARALSGCAQRSEKDENKRRRTAIAQVHYKAPLWVADTLWHAIVVH